MLRLDGKPKKKVKKYRSLPYFKEILKEKRLSYEDVSEMTGYCVDSIYRFANGKQGSKKMIQVISRELEVNQALISRVVDI